MIEHHMGEVHTWTCDTCGDHRTDYGLEATCLIQARHICGGANMPEGKTVILLCWEELDKVMDEFMPLYAAMRGGTIALGDEARLEHLKAKARGMAEIMQYWTLPHFRTADEIAKEATARYRARVAGEERETLGTVVGRAGVDLAATYARQGVSTRPAPTARAAAPKPAAATVKPQDAAAIKNGHASGLFSVEELAKMYKLTVQQVTSIVTG